MIGYRLFLLRNEHVHSAREFTAEGDEEALAQAERLRQGEAAELWLLARKVHVFPGCDAAEPRS